MSTDVHRDPSRRTGPGRFVSDDPAQGRTGSRWTGVAALLVLLALVVGVPVALPALGGAPHLPTSWPTREQLAGTIGVEQVLAVLVWIVWLAWLQFTICVLVEVRSAVAGVGLPRRVPLAGPSQRVARTLVASVLLLLTAAGQANAVVTPLIQEHLSSTVAITAPAVAGEVAATVAQPDAPVEATSVAQGVTYQLGGMTLDADEGAELVGKRVYVVQPPEGRYHDNLWDIAERTLGDGRRYQEIFELNRGRDQPDGHELSLARLIYPNWLLVVPEDAVGVDRVVAVAPAEAVAPVPVAPVEAPATDAAAVPSQPSDGPAASVEQGSDRVSGIGALAGSALLAAGLLVAVDRLRRRRRTPEPSDEAVELEVALRVGADAARAVLLDGALRQLSGAVQVSGRALPDLYAVQVGDSAVVLHLAPPDVHPPHPWTSSADGRRWTLDAATHRPVAPRGVPAPYPGLVSIGRDDAGVDVLVDLEAAQGPISVVGDPTAARDVVAALAAELASNPWSDDLRVTGVDLHGGLAALGPRRYRSVRTARDAVPALEERQPDVLGADVLSGRLRTPGRGAWVPEYVVLGALPDASTADELLRLTSTQRRAPLGLVCAGDLPGARWRLVVDEAGTLTFGVLDLAVRANRLSAQQAASVAELLSEEPPTPLDPRAAAELEENVTRPDVPPAPRPLEPADLAAAPVRVRVLGAPLVEAARAIEPERVALCTELVVHLALQPDGVHPTVLGAALWPGGVTPAVRDATVERARAWLGTDAHGHPHLRLRDDGRLHLGPDVVLDWDVVHSLLARARTATDRATERRDLAAALRLVQGGVLARRPPGKYAWLARVRLERVARDLLVDAAHRLAVLCSLDDDPDGARAAAWSGLGVAPTEELLWRDVLRSAAVQGADDVRQVAADLEATLHAAGVAEIGAPTVALLEELVPSDTGRAAPGSA